MFRKVFILFVGMTFVFEQTGFCQAVTNPDISAMLSGMFSQQAKFRPVHLRSLSFDSTTGDFEVYADKGDAKNLSAAKIKDDSGKLFEYFLTGLVLPNNMFWVNLRPDSPDAVIDPLLNRSDIGKVLLEADLQLKKDMAKFTAPDSAMGKAFWEKLYAKAETIFGSSTVTLPTLSRPWIVPGDIIIYETSNGAYIYKAILQVMLEQDRLQDGSVYNFADARYKELNDYSAQLIRETILPLMTKEINSSARYAQLRQVFYSLILAQWFKKRFSGSAGAYAARIDSKNLTGLMSHPAWKKEPYFQAYKDSFGKGEYNTQETVKGETALRRYFCGGVLMLMPQFDTPDQNIGLQTKQIATNQLATQMLTEVSALNQAAAQTVINAKLAKNARILPAPDLEKFTILKGNIKNMRLEGAFLVPNIQTITRRAAADGGTYVRPIQVAMVNILPATNIDFAKSVVMKALSVKGIDVKAPAAVSAINDLAPIFMGVSIPQNRLTEIKNTLKINDTDIKEIGQMIEISAPATPKIEITSGNMRIVNISGKLTVNEFTPIATKSLADMGIDVKSPAVIKAISDLAPAFTGAVISEAKFLDIKNALKIDNAAVEAIALKAAIATPRTAVVNVTPVVDVDFAKSVAVKALSVRGIDVKSPAAEIAITDLATKFAGVQVPQTRINEIKSTLNINDADIKELGQMVDLSAPAIPRIQNISGEISIPNINVALGIQEITPIVTQSLADIGVDVKTPEATAAIKELAPVFSKTKIPEARFLAIKNTLNIDDAKIEAIGIKVALADGGKPIQAAMVTMTPATNIDFAKSVVMKALSVRGIDVKSPAAEIAINDLATRFTDLQVSPARLAEIKNTLKINDTDIKEIGQMIEISAPATPKIEITSGNMRIVNISGKLTVNEFTPIATKSLADMGIDVKSPAVIKAISDLAPAFTGAVISEAKFLDIKNALKIDNAAVEAIALKAAIATPRTAVVNVTPVVDVDFAKSVAVKALSVRGIDVKSPAAEIAITDLATKFAGVQVPQTRINEIKSTLNINDADIKELGQMVDLSAPAIPRIQNISGEISIPNINVALGIQEITPIVTQSLADIGVDVKTPEATAAIKELAPVFSKTKIPEARFLAIKNTLNIDDAKIEAIGIKVALAPIQNIVPAKIALPAIQPVAPIASIEIPAVQPIDTIGAPKAVGGVDLATLPAINLDMGRLSSSGSVALDIAALSAQWAELNKQLRLGKAPLTELRDFVRTAKSGNNTEELLNACAYSIAEILRNEEENAVPTSVEMKEVLANLFS